MLDAERKIQKLTPDPFRRTAPREEHYFSGSIQLGTMPHFDFSYGLNLDALVTHLLILGATGGGKTTVIKNLLMQILQQPDPPKLMILERKQEFTELLNLTSDVHVLDANTLAFNPLRPPYGIKLNKWIGIFTECMVNYMDIREASSSFLMDHAFRLIDEKNSEGEFPTLGDLRSFIAQQPYKPFSKNGQQKETVLNRLNDLFCHFPAMFSSDKQTDVEKLVNNHCLILLHDITHSTIQNFLMSLLMAQAFLYRKLTRGLQDSLTNLIVFDEASGLFHRKAEEQDHVPFIADLVQTARGYGIGLIAASQYATDLAHSLLANAGTRMMVGGFGRTQDTELFLKLRGYTTKHRQYVNTHPDVGKAFVVDKRWPHIIECNMTLPNLPPRLEPDELKARMGASSKFFSVDLGVVEGLEQTETLVMPGEPRPAQITVEPESKTISIEARLLRHIYEDHFVRLRERAEALEVKAGTLRKEVERLHNNGLIVVHKAHSGSSGSPRDLYEIKAAGCRIIGVPPHPAMKGRGSYLHKFYQQHVALYFKSQGYDTKIEGRADREFIDVIAEKQGEECVAVEIELNREGNPDHVVENLKGCMAARRITRTLCLVTKNDEIKRVEKLVTKHGLERGHLQIDRISKYMEV